jgi:hypothetical protein
MSEASIVCWLTQLGAVCTRVLFEHEFTLMPSTQIQNHSQAPVAHTCNPSYSGSRYQEDHGSKPTLGKQFMRPYLIKTLHKKGLVEARGEGPGFKSQYWKKKWGPPSHPPLSISVSLLPPQWQFWSPMNPFTSFLSTKFLENSIINIPTRAHWNKAQRFSMCSFVTRQT